MFNQSWTARLHLSWKDDELQTFQLTEETSICRWGSHASWGEYPWKWLKCHCLSLVRWNSCLTRYMCSYVQLGCQDIARNPLDSVSEHSGCKIANIPRELWQWLSMQKKLFVIHYLIGSIRREHRLGYEQEWVGVWVSHTACIHWVS